MAKTVKIPDNPKPWTCMINGVSYLYEAGSTQEVPDEVANFIEHLANIKPEPAPVTKPFPAGSGTGDWNDLKNRPFYEETTYSDTVVWDGTPTDISVNIGYTLYHISDFVPTLEQVNAPSILTIKGERIEIAEATTNGYGVIVAIGCLVIPEDDMTDESSNITFPKKGIYGQADHALSWQFPGVNVASTTTIKPIDKKFLPEALQFGMEVGQTLFEGVIPSGTDPTQIELSAVAGQIYAVTCYGVAYYCTAVDFNGVAAIGNMGLAGMGEDTGEPFLIAVDGASASTMVAGEETSMTIAETIIHPIGKAYLPKPLILSADFQFPETDAELSSLWSNIKAHVASGLPAFFEYSSGSGSGASYTKIPLGEWWKNADYGGGLRFFDRLSRKMHTFNFAERTYTEETFEG